jgi:hypothetical protein
MARRQWSTRIAALTLVGVEATLEAHLLRDCFTAAECANSALLPSKTNALLPGQVQ